MAGVDSRRAGERDEGVVGDARSGQAYNSQYVEQMGRENWKLLRRLRGTAKRLDFVVSRCESELHPDEISEAHVWFVLQKGTIQTYSRSNSDIPTSKQP